MFLVKLARAFLMLALLGSPRAFAGDAPLSSECQ